MKKLFTILCVLLTQVIFAQTGMLKGTVLHQDTRLPFHEVSVTIPSLKQITTTNEEGVYQFSNVPYGTYELRIEADGTASETVNVSVTGAVTMVDPIELKSAASNDPNYSVDNSTVNVEDASSEDQSSNSSTGQNVSSVLNASRDAYLSAATFGWGQYFYRMRGYENDENTLQLNGVPLNDLEEGGVFYNSWSGLNDVFRGRTVSLGLAPLENGFGSLGLNTSLDASASNQR